MKLTVATLLTSSAMASDLVWVAPGFQNQHHRQLQNNIQSCFPSQPAPVRRLMGGGNGGGNGNPNTGVDKMAICHGTASDVMPYTVCDTCALAI